MLLLSHPVDPIRLGAAAVCPPVRMTATVTLTDPFIGRVFVVLVVALIHAAYILAVVNTQSVIAAARAYARQLILSTETFIAAGKKSRPAKRAGGAAA